MATDAPRAARAARRTLQVLTAAALALPGLGARPAAAADEPELSVEASRYDEGPRDLAGRTYQELNLHPIRVDSVAVDAAFTLSDRVRLALGFTQDTWSGASPVLSLPNAAVAAQLLAGASIPAYYYTDAAGRPVVVDFAHCDPVTGACPTTHDPRLVHLMGSASPETRREGRFTLSWDFPRSSFSLGGGFSDEPDFHSLFFSLGGRFDFDRRLTTLSWSASYTDDRIAASLAANTAADWTLYQGQIGLRHGEPTLFGRRHDVSASVSLTRVLNRRALFEAGLSYTRDEGLLMDPYKAVMFAFNDPGQFIFDPNLRFVQLRGVLEHRPAIRNQLALTARYVQFVPGLRAAVHAGYRFYVDDWGVKAHTFELDWRQPLGRGWLIAPQVRYYSQSRARFYRPYFLFNQPFPGVLTTGPLDYAAIPVTDYASDERLSAFGAISGGATLEKTLPGGATLEAGFEAYAHRGRLRLGGGGEGAFSDFDATTFRLGFRTPLTGRPVGGSAVTHDATGEARREDGDAEALFTAPAGVRFAHTLDRPGAAAIDLDFGDDQRDGGMRRDGALLSAAMIADQACGPSACLQAPVRLRRRELAADLIYQLSPALTLIATPRLIEDQVVFHPLGPPPPAGAGASLGPLLGGRHSAGGLGDLDLAALVRLADGPGWRLTAGLGVSAPTGSAGARLNTSSLTAPFALQTGSGTWDLLPSLTWTGEAGPLGWGVQASAVKRLEGANSAGYRLGDRIEASAWAATRLTPWLEASVRGVWGGEGQIHGPAGGSANHPPLSPLDLAANSGGRWFDLGAGLTATARGGALKGDSLAIEWRTPIVDQRRGVQVPRTGALAIRAGVVF